MFNFWQYILQINLNIQISHLEVEISFKLVYLHFHIWLRRSLKIGMYYMYCTVGKSRLSKKDTDISTWFDVYVLNRIHIKWKVLSNLCALHRKPEKMVKIQIESGLLFIAYQSATKAATIHCKYSVIARYWEVIKVQM